MSARDGKGKHTDYVAEHHGDVIFGRGTQMDCTRIEANDMAAMLMAFGQIPYESKLVEMFWFPLDQTWNAIYEHPACDRRVPGVPMEREPEPLVLDMRVLAALKEQQVVQVQEAPSV